MPMKIVCSRTQAFNAARVAKEIPFAETIIDHYTEGDYLYLFDERTPPAGIDVAAIKKRESECPFCKRPWQSQP